MLAMLADDDGFVNSPKSIMRQAGATTDDLKLLIAKRFILTFESGVVVIKHWRIHNLIQKDRYKETTYLDEKSLLTLDDNKAYTEAIDDVETPCIQPVSKVETQVSIGKVSKGKVSVVEGSVADGYATATTNVENSVENPVENFGYYIDRIAKLYQKICTSLHPLKAISDESKLAIKESLKTYTVNDFEEVFTIAQKSSFLTGAGDRGWVASFNWLVQASNMKKVLDGKYTDKPKQAVKQEKPNDSSFDLDEAWATAMNRTDRIMKEMGITAEGEET